MGNGLTVRRWISRVDGVTVHKANAIVVRTARATIPTELFLTHSSEGERFAPETQESPTSAAGESATRIIKGQSLEHRLELVSLGTLCSTGSS